MTDKTYEMSLLFDFFGDFLTEKQREYFDLHYNEDLSLSEIAANVGITRQGVRDIIVRAENTLVEAEEKTGIIKRFFEHTAEIEKATAIAQEISLLSENNERLLELSSQLQSILSGLKN